MSILYTVWATKDYQVPDRSLRIKFRQEVLQDIDNSSSFFLYDYTLAGFAQILLPTRPTISRRVLRRERLIPDISAESEIEREYKMRFDRGEGVGVLLFDSELMGKVLGKSGLSGTKYQKFVKSEGVWQPLYQEPRSLER